ncbi:helix-turn-helix domain-containing protein [Cupriavidus sp. L7L]|uniref:helix-turn-helix domain-containing protein n=1 Tax=Cupriavidus sp. L7L TaxID=2546443 RepID=UPI0010549058|nr:helix-turn-helix domain-containing protein [Cupriavidus sp. L7L]TDF66154.1 helix-turn-helix domain-containing protein [Cupriavidus sp. L7L]
MSIDIDVTDKPYYSTRTAAKLLNVSLGTVQKMVERGELGAWKTNGGHRRIHKETVHNLLATRVGSQPASEHELDLVVFHPNHQEAQRIHSQLSKWGLPLKSVVVEDVLDTVITSVSAHPRVVLYYVEELDDAESATIEKLQNFFSKLHVVFAVITNRQAYDGVADALQHWGIMVFLKTPSLEEVKGFLRAQLMIGRRG